MSGALPIGSLIAEENRRHAGTPLDADEIRMIERVWHEAGSPHDSASCSICREADEAGEPRAFKIVWSDRTELVVGASSHEHARQIAGRRAEELDLEAGVEIETVEVLALGRLRLGRLERGAS